ncbi:unnamed protein product [Rotaria sordida]|uniref:Helicase ATP-binding domain-containing protein n=1 Tax=Rotaria sordida TaxID=392033 RepID=A0A813XWR0_9BILA|nr:unnamed protein product [Rotaria sordida]CAF0874216.1 unnamed protein product [Rotaria sordida]
MPGFSLIHLRYLVIDEADRIIDKFKQDWLNVLDTVIGLSSHLKNDFQPYILSQSSSNHKIYQELFFSATLTHNPEILQQLNLFRLIEKYYCRRDDLSFRENTNNYVE